MKSEQKWIQKLLRGLWTLSVVLLAAVLFHVAGAKLSGQVPEICGYSIFRITTGSMEPTIPTGTYIVTRRVPPVEIQKGDIITFYSTDPDIAGFPNTHRVVDKPLRTGGGMVYATKGDANPIRDSYYVHESRLIGKYQCSLTRLSAFLNFFMTGRMLMLLLVTQVLSFVMMTVSVRLLQQHRQEKQLEKQLQQAREEVLRKAMKELEEGGPDALLRLQRECAEPEGSGEREKDREEKP